MDTHVWYNARIAPRADPAQVLEHAALIVVDGRVRWVGSAAETPAVPVNATHHDLGGRIVTPGLVDCHTHLVHAGQRADEFAQRLAGVSYEAIARAGGGIMSTVRATRAASEAALYTQSAQRLEALIAGGVTAVEIKSGYGLDLSAERKMLRVARRLGRAYPISVSTTFLGAHALPDEYRQRSDDYIDYLCQTMLPALHEEHLVDAVDAFCERIAFSAEQCARVFKTAERLGLPVKVHAEQLSLCGGTAMAARHRALSADHLEYLDAAGVSAMRDAGSVAVLLPGAFYFLRETQKPPIALLREHGVPIAIATDCNPGSSPTTSLVAMMNMGCVAFGLTVPEVLAGTTHHAARALGNPQVDGEIKVGSWADFVVWSVDSLAELPYWIGHAPAELVVRHGEVAYRKPTSAR
ncbi:MAG: imidazolonepropionase [Janthinobacterium lividum]